jgi:hypothetical protein
MGLPIETNQVGRRHGSPWCINKRRYKGELNMKTRNEMIEQLLEADLNSSDTDHLYYVLRDGFVGYRNQTDAELLAELEARGLV